MTKAAKKPTRKRPDTADKAGSAASAADVRPDLPERVFEPALCFVGEAQPGIWGMTTRDRLIRQFAREGIGDVVALDQAARRNGPLILLRADAVIDPPLVPVLIRRPNLALTDPSGETVQVVAITIGSDNAAAAAGVMRKGGLPGDELKLLVRAPDDLETSFWKGLRKREVPYARIVLPDNKADVEWRMFMGTYKGATDLVTKYVWPRPAFHVTRRLAPTSITPNMVTTLSALCVALAFWLFLEGHFLTGLLAAWMMTFLDTVDGKLARTTLTSSKWGDIFDHGIDLIHPPFWYIAWGYGLAASGHAWSGSFLWLVLGAILAGYVVQRLMEGAAIKWLGLEIHIWRPIDTWFRLITARRNPNLVLLSLATVAGRPDIGLIAVAIWTVACLALHGLQLLQGFAAKKGADGLTSWMSQPVRPE